jgi:hypothetical protein
MKVSELIEEIVEAATVIFGISAHPNDNIDVGIHYSPNAWQVWLQRPTQRQLNCGEIPIELCHTVKIYEYNCELYCVGETLMEALHTLLDLVYMAADSGVELTA